MTLGHAPNEWQGRPLWAEIDLDALAANIGVLRQRAGGASLMAIVKANAYGHGAVPIAEAALEAGAGSLGVICVDEGRQLRAAGIRAPIVVLGHTPVAQAEEIVAHSLTATVNSLELGRAIARHAAAAGTRAPVHVKVDTGLSRYGSLPDECVALAEALRGLASIEVEGIYTHFASADEGDPTFTRQQFARFLATCERVPWIGLRHASASGALLALPEMSLDVVRTGIAMYGYPPGALPPGTVLRPVLSLRSRLARVTQLAAGDTVSYGRTWRASEPTTVGLVMAGYADGLPRLASNRGSMLVRGRRVPILGRVCMDQCVVDLTSVPNAAVDDEVTIIGSQGGERIGADELAALCGTISYEVLTGITARVPRLFLREGRVVRVQTLLGETLAAPAVIG